jgi:hypothetical protein
VSLPEQIRRQSEAIAKMYEAEAPAPADAPADAASAAPADREAPSVVEPTSTEQPAAAPVVEDSADWVQRYRTLQGMYNADRARHQAELAQRDARLTQLEQLLSSMQTAAPRAPEPAPAEKLVTQKDVDDYGESLEVMRRVSREEVAAQARRIAELEQVINKLQTNVVPRVEHVAQQQAISAEQSFWNSLSSTVPAWKDINNDQQFHAWLLEVDPLTGAQRQSHLEDAQRKLDATRVASFFTTWQRMKGPEPAQPTRSASSSELERQVAPGRSRAGSSSPSAATAAKGRTYTPQDISKFFDDVRRGLYRGREAERDRLERDIFAAQQDNRIVSSA